MSWLLDTNVVSDLRRPERTNGHFRSWFERHANEALYVSVVTIGELEQGVCSVERRDGAQGALLRSWLEERVLPTFDGRTIAVDTEVARAAAALRVPDPAPWPDSIIAATALVHDLALVTRNVTDFAIDGLTVHDPWAAP